MQIPNSTVIVDFLHPVNKIKKFLPEIKNMPKTYDINQQTITIIVPVYNEIQAIKEFHKELIEKLKNLTQPHEIIYIDDNSTDGTYEWLIKQTAPGFLATASIRQNNKNNSFPLNQTDTPSSPFIKGGQGDLHATAFITKGGKAQKTNTTIKVLRKEGKKGKAYSLIQGFEKATGSILVMIDGDLQYPPSAIEPMIKQLESADLVVANRQYKKVSLIRKITSKTFKNIFSKAFELNCDLQSGLKVFKRTVYEATKFQPKSSWTFDLELLHRAKFAGFKITGHNITFSPRTAGKSKLNILLSTFEICLQAIRLKSTILPPMIIPPLAGTMRNAGIGYKYQKYITHTTLSHHESAFKTFSRTQLAIFAIFLIISITAILTLPLLFARIIITILSLLYFIDTIFNLYLILTSLRNPLEIAFDFIQLQQINDKKLPIYSILCPLYKEANVVMQFIKAIEKLDWPKEKLDVILLLEEDDKATIEEVTQLSLPSFVRTIIVPDSLPKTKPKACNYGLSYAKGEFLVIYDAEDIPDPLQLKKAYLAFQTLPENVRCLQAKLNYYNPNQNFLTRLFTAEYSLWFDLTLTGLQSLNTSIPLGGTSNHFKVNDLKKLQGWDPFNVTEDADLGIRLFKKGYKTAIIDSTTLEEANSVFTNWFRQRSRWIKGYFQTYLVHSRDIRKFIKENGWKHAFLFQLTVGGKLLFLLINPLMWLITIIYFTLHKTASPIIEYIYYQPIGYIAVFSWIFGNFLFLYYYMIACGKRNQWNLVKFVYLVPIYWLMMSYAGILALVQLILKPHYWEKTIHGFHLARQSEVTAVSRGQKVPVFRPKPATAIPDILPHPIKTENYKKTNSSRSPQLIKYLAVGLYYLLFLLADILLVSKTFPHNIAYPYYYLSIIGKGIYISGQIISISLLIFLKKTHANVKEKREVSYLIFSTFLTTWIEVIIFNLQLIPAIAASPLLPAFSIAMMCFSIANVFVLYNVNKKVYTFLFVAYLITALHLFAIYNAGADLSRVTLMTLYLAIADVLLMFTLHLNKNYLSMLENNIAAFSNLLTSDSARKSWEEKTMRILIFNWRDTRHIFAGGAEVYIQQMAKRWAKQGNKVTIFCGNDGRSPANETIDDVQIYRRGGTYTVYLFAIIYYLLKFRNKYDIIIDCENGIPFFTPLFTRKPLILIIHHVHQEIIRKYLRFPLNIIAANLESKLMPRIYKNKKIVTVSQSSKEEIIKLGFAIQDNIEIIHNGNSLKTNTNTTKTPHPSFIYLGRLQEYKNIDTAITAFAQIAKKHQTASLKIVGSGESLTKLKHLVNTLGITDKVQFLGRVSPNLKIKLLSESWAAIQPSSMEGWGITVIEANACKTPVIASNVHGLRDSVIDGRTGILVENRNPNQLAAIMEQLIIDTQLLEKLSLEAYQWSKNFSWNKSADLFYNLIGECIPMHPLSAAPAYNEIKTGILNKNYEK